MKDQPFIVRQRANIHSSAPFNQNEDAVEKTKKVGKFVAKQAIKQGLKSAGQKALAATFGIAGSLLSPTTVYAGPERKEKGMSWEEVDAFQKERDAQKYIPK